MHRRLFVGLAVLFLGISWLTAGEKDDSAESVFNVTSEGMPGGYTGPQRGPRYYVWSDGEGWHLRARTGGKRWRFQGMVRITGGKVTRLTGLAGLEYSGKETDSGYVNSARNTITFKMTTGKTEDGINFHVTPDTEKVGFKLLINGYEHPERITIGAAGDHPPYAEFWLPAGNETKQEVKSPLTQ